MRCTWLYVLGSAHTLEDSYVYVGMTYRLVTRLNEHHAQTGKGANATQRWNYDTLLAVYKIDDREEHDHGEENRLTAEIMFLKGAAWWTVRGGSSTSTQKDRTMPEQVQLLRDALSETGLQPRTCYCMLPCDKKVSKEGKAYLSCAGQNAAWLEDKIQQNVSPGCKFFVWL